MQETQKSKMALEHGIVSTTNFTHNHQPSEAAKIPASLRCLRRRRPIRGGRAACRNERVITAF